MFVKCFGGVARIALDFPSVVYHKSVVLPNSQNDSIMTGHFKPSTEVMFKYAICVMSNSSVQMFQSKEINRWESHNSQLCLHHPVVGCGVSKEHTQR